MFNCEVGSISREMGVKGWNSEGGLVIRKSVKEECASGTDFRTFIFLQFFANMLLVWIHFEVCCIIKLFTVLFL